MNREEERSAIRKALQVMVLDRRHRAWLEANDPKALDQAVKALEAGGFAHTPEPRCEALNHACCDHEYAPPVTCDPDEVVG